MIMTAPSYPSMKPSPNSRESRQAWRRSPDQSLCLVLLRLMSRQVILMSTTARVIVGDGYVFSF